MGGIICALLSVCPRSDVNFTIVCKGPGTCCSFLALTAVPDLPTVTNRVQHGNEDGQEQGAGTQAGCGSRHWPHLSASSPLPANTDNRTAARDDPEGHSAGARCRLSPNDAGLVPHCCSLAWALPRTCARPAPRPECCSRLCLCSLGGPRPPSQNHVRALGLGLSRWNVGLLISRL